MVAFKISVQNKKKKNNRQIILLECTDSEQKIAMAHFKDDSISALFKVKICKM